MMPGEVIVRKNGQDRFLAVGEGTDRDYRQSRRDPDGHGHRSRKH
jgi:hypothetical protein